MAGGIDGKFTGNLTGDPEQGTTNNGMPLARFGVALNTRVKRNGEWVDGRTFFVRCTVFGDVAVNVVATLSKGMPVVIVGEVTEEEWTDKEGNQRTSLNCVPSEIGLNLRFAQAQVQQGSRQGRQQPAQQPAQQPQAQGGQGGWGGQQNAPQQPAQGGWGGGQQSYDEPPF